MQYLSIGQSTPCQEILNHVRKIDGRKLKLRTACSELFNCTFIMRKCRYQCNGHPALSEPLFCQYPISRGNARTEPSFHSGSIYGNTAKHAKEKTLQDDYIRQGISMTASFSVQKVKHRQTHCKRQILQREPISDCLLLNKYIKGEKRAGRFTASSSFL